MYNIVKSADQLVGKTPLLELTHIEKELNLEAKMLLSLSLRQEIPVLVLRPLQQRRDSGLSL